MSECGPLIEDFRDDMLMAFEVVSASLYAVLPNRLDNVQKDPEHIYIGELFQDRGELGAGPAPIGPEIPDDGFG